MKKSLKKGKKNMNQEVEILIGGRPVRKYGHEGRTFVEARDGTEYSIRIRNNNSARVEAVATVDGLSVVDGKAGTKTSSGYVIPAFGSYEIKGFRTSNEQVNAFRFAPKQNSYAANSEESNFSDQHCGAIAVVIFPEKQKPIPAPQWNYKPQPEYIPVPYPVPVYPRPRPNPWRHPYHEPMWGGGTICKSTGDVSGDSHTYTMGLVESSVQSRCMSFNSSAPAMVKSSVNFDLGTEFSDKVVRDKVTTTAFERGHEGANFIIYYASRQVLEAMGVPLDKETQVATNFPDPFPKDTGRYCKPPVKRA